MPMRRKIVITKLRCYFAFFHYSQVNWVFNCIAKHTESRSPWKPRYLLLRIFIFNGFLSYIKDDSIHKKKHLWVLIMPRNVFDKIVNSDILFLMNFRLIRGINGWENSFFLTHPMGQSNSVFNISIFQKSPICVIEKNWEVTSCSKCSLPLSFPPLISEQCCLIIQDFFLEDMIGDGRSIQ